jgi:hypothetical protein
MINMNPDLFGAALDKALNLTADNPVKFSTSFHHWLFVYRCREA